MDEFEQEFTNALAQGRQPNCIYCGEPLEVYQVFSYWVEFIWDKNKKRYRKVEDYGDASKAECKSCEAKSWDFVGQHEAGRKLGLDY